MVANLSTKMNHNNSLMKALHSIQINPMVIIVIIVIIVICDLNYSKLLVHVTMGMYIKESELSI